MITFIWPWSFLLLPLPVLVRRWLPPLAGAYDTALKLPIYASLGSLAEGNTGPPFWNRQLILPLITWSLLIAAIAQPVWIGDDQPVPVTGRDLMLLIDVSGSMRSMDFMHNGAPADRLTVVKDVASRFVEGRRGDRIGLILFGDKPYLRASLSHDHKAIKQLIQEAEIALAGESTAIGDAIGLAIKRMRELNSDSRVIVLLTDGANNEGRIPPRQAARLALIEGIRIYTIGVGVPDTPAPNPYGIWSANDAGRFEREVLEQVAQTTQGHFFHVLDGEGLQAAYDRLDQLEPVLGEDVRKYLGRHLYPWPLGAALVSSIVLVLRARPSLWKRGQGQ